MQGKRRRMAAVRKRKAERKRIMNRSAERGGGGWVGGIHVGARWSIRGIRMWKRKGKGDMLVEEEDEARIIKGERGREGG